MSRRILYYFKDRDSNMYKWQHLHIFDELAKSGNYIEVFNPLHYKSIAVANESLIKKIKSNRYDLFMTPHNHTDLYIHTLQEIKRLGIPTLLICFDNLSIPYFHKKIAPYFDLVWLTSYETEYLLKKWGANTIFQPYAANPTIGNGPVNGIKEICFIGTPYGSRPYFINALTNNNIPVSIYYSVRKSSTATNIPIEKISKIDLIKGLIPYTFFPIGRKIIHGAIKNRLTKQSILDYDNTNLHWNQGLGFKEMMDTYGRHTLSFTSVTTRNTGILKKPVYVVNLRSFEIAASGGLIFSLRCPELESYFPDGTEGVYFENNAEMVEKAKFYLNPKNQKLVMTMKHRAWEKAKNEHSWLVRFNRIFSILNI